MLVPFRNVLCSCALALAAMAVQPAIGQTAATPTGTAPTRFSVLVEGAAAGKAPDVILIPGLASSRDDYAAEAKLLEPAYRLHLVQIAGFAGEPAGPNASGPILGPVVEQLHAYITDNHLHPAIIGHSMGGLLALMLVDAHPGDASKLLIVDTLPFYGLVFDPNATVETVKPQAQAMHDGMLAMPKDKFDAGEPMFASRLVSDPAGIKLVASGAVASDRTVFVNAMLEDLSTDLRPHLASIKTPMTLLYPYKAVEGSESEVTALYKTAYATMPQVKFVRIDDSLHFIMLDQPAAFHQAVLAFLQAGPATGNSH